MTITKQLAFYSRDGFFCKDGRGWSGGAGGSGHGLEWPWPSTVRGAVRTLWGRAHEAIIAQQGWLAATASIELGPTLAMWRRRGASALERRWPVPADVEYVRSPDSAPDLPTLHYLHPTSSQVATLGRDDDPARERLWIAPPLDRGKPGPKPRWWTEAQLSAWLTGSSVPAEPAVAVVRPARRRVTRAAIDPATQTVVDSALFSHDVIETVERDGEWAIAVQVTLPDGQITETATLGSDRRLARVDEIDRAAFDPPPALAAASAAGSLGLRLLVITPAIFGRGWLPDGFDARGDEYRGALAGIEAELVLRAAITPRPVPISGWDIAARPAGAPRRTNLAVAPGSVYFFQRADGGRFTAADVCGRWLAELGRRTEDGFGRVVAAPWTTPISGVSA